MTRIPPWLSAVALVVVMALGGSYLVVNVFRYTPMQGLVHVSVDMSDSGGLRRGSDVVYRGVNIGQVEQVQSVSGGVRLDLSYADTYRIPVGSAMKIENLSALGEPVFAFLPDSSDGPWLRDDAQLQESVKIPTSVPELLASTSNLVDQADPAVVTGLVDEFSASLDGIAPMLPDVRRGADLLVTTLMRHQPSLETAMRNVMKMMEDADWVKPALTSAPPQLDSFGETLGTSYEYLFEGSEILRGDEVLGSWHEEEDQLVEFLKSLAPEIGAIGVALRPVSMAVGPVFGMFDFGTLLEQALTALPGDRVRLALTIPK